MRNILPAKTLAQRLSGKQNIKAGTRYRISTYCVETECEDGVLLFNTFTGAMYLLEKGETIGDFRDYFIENRFLVPEELDEKAYIDGIRKAAQVMQPPADAVTDFTIFTTTDCNARCFYCYERGSKRVSMSPETASDIAGYIAKVCKGRPVKLNWFGGEPLYNKKAIDIITSRLRELGVEYISGMTSNGFYLDAETVKRARTLWNLTKVQITIDGTKDTYNRTKAYIDKDNNPYETVVGNIENALKEGISVVIRLNMDSKNADDLILVARELAERFRGKGDCSFAAMLLREFSGKVHSFDTEKKAIEKYFELHNLIKELGFETDQKLYRDLNIGRCKADSDSAQVLLPDGKIGKCEHFSDSEFIGNIYSPEYDTDMIASWKEHDVSLAECNDCKLYPECYNLKKCEWTKNGCPEHVRAIRLTKLKDRIVREYDRTKAFTKNDN